MSQFKYRSGLVVGKFSPLHAGHQYLISTAASQCEHLTILNYSNPSLPGCDAEERRFWLSNFCAEFSNVSLHILEDDLPDNDAPASKHRAFCAEFLLYDLEISVDVVFSSEDYGDDFAFYLSTYFSLHFSNVAFKNVTTVRHVCLDKSRIKFPISGTDIRSNPQKFASFLSPTVLSSFIPRVAVLGGESSGKSTLVDDLALKTGFPGVPEYGRQLYDELGGALRYEDMVKIAGQQISLEREATINLPAANKPVLFCDTTPLTTAFYSQCLFNRVSTKLQKAANRSYDFYVLCSNDIPFCQDGTRKDDEFRNYGYLFYKDWLKENGHPFIEVSGSRQQRVQQVLDWIKAPRKLSEQN